MKKGLFIVLIALVIAAGAMAQTIKTGVLVIGNGNSAVGAGFQSALSGVKTTMLIQTADFDITSTGQSLASGLEFELLKKVRLAKGIIDSAAGITDSTVKVALEKISANPVLSKWADSTKNLSVIRSIKWSRIKRTGNNWNVLLEDGRTIKAEVLVNADGSGNLNGALALSTPSKPLWQPLTYQDNQYRLSLSSGYFHNNSTANIIPMYNFLLPGEENLVMLDGERESIAAGQAGGAVAAYAVFFQTKTSLAALKPIQKELISFKLSVMPFADLNPQDPNWKPIQFVGLSGFLKGIPVNGSVHFSPEQVVTTAEIREPVKAFYYKAQIWFDDYKEPTMTIGSLIDMIAMVGNKGLEHTKATVEKNWSSAYQFNGEFDLNRAVTRREFSVLVDEYLNPFQVNIDRNGRVVR